MVLGSTVRTSPCRQPGGASGQAEHTEDTQSSQHKGDVSDELRGTEAYFELLTAEVSKAAAALGSGSDQSLVVSAGRNVGLT